MTAARKPCKRPWKRTGYADFWSCARAVSCPSKPPITCPSFCHDDHGKERAGYGLDQVQMDPPIEYDTVELTALTALP